jgi:hypothetical protein
MRSARALILLGSIATALSVLAFIVLLAVLLEHSLHPPHADADLVLGLVGLVVCMAALGASLNVLLTGIARRGGPTPADEERAPGPSAGLAAIPAGTHGQAGVLGGARAAPTVACPHSPGQRCRTSRQVARSLSEESRTV